MGGKNPQVVLDDADLGKAVELSVQSAFYSTGQRCTASSRLIVTEGIYPKFVEAMQGPHGEARRSATRWRRAPTSARSRARASSSRT